MRVLVFANGTIDDLDVVREYLGTADMILCADGGARYASALGVQPHTVIGDMDSFPPNLRAELEAAGTVFVTYSAAKDETDLELALLYAVERGATQIIVFGARGDRVDHELGNILLLVHPRLREVDVRLVSGAQEVGLVRRERTFCGKPGDLLSLLPIGGDAQGITTSGLEYPLRDESLFFGSARGVSNVFAVSEPIVRLRSGFLLAVHTHCPLSGCV